MSVLTVTTNLTPGVDGFKVRYKKIGTTVWSALETKTTNPFTITTPDAQNTNYDIEIFNDCGVPISTTSTYTTNFTCNCNVANVYNVVVGACVNDTHSLSFDVDFSCMKNDMGVITSVFDILIDGIHHSFVNPTLQTGTQTITITLPTTNSTRTLTVNCVSAF